MAQFNLRVNGEMHQVDVDPDTPVLWVLRDNLNLVGTKYSCGISECGTCTIHLDGVAIKACAVPVMAAENKSIITIEGLSKDGDHPLQLAWKKHDVPQCGYCQGGQIMNAAALIKENPNPTDDEIDVAMNGNICRCATYIKIKAAIKSAINS